MTNSKRQAEEEQRHQAWAFGSACEIEANQQQGAERSDSDLEVQSISTKLFLVKSAKLP